MSEIFDRERLVLSYMLEHPYVIEAEDALAAVVWPSSDLASRFPALGDTIRTRHHPCATCGCSLDEETEGCSRCRERHRMRSRRQRSKEREAA